MNLFTQIYEYFKMKIKKREEVRIFKEQVKLPKKLETSSAVEFDKTRSVQDITKQNLSFNQRKIGAGSKGYTNKNKDSFFLDTNIVSVADGVGESIGSGIAAEFVAKKFAEEFKKLEKVDFESIRGILTKLGNFLKQIYEKEYVESGKIDFRYVLTDFLATTLLAVVELQDSYIVIYCGNGSIWYVRGDFWEFLESKRKWPWCIEDIVIPHSTYIGMEALTGFLNYKGLIGEPVIMQLNKNYDKGDIFILTTDGISSKDQLKIGYSKVDKEIPESLEINNNIYKVLLVLKEFLYKAESFVTLSDEIKKFLDSNAFYDDATIGILISERAMQYFEEKMSKRNNKIVKIL